MFDLLLNSANPIKDVYFKKYTRRILEIRYIKNQIIDIQREISKLFFGQDIYYINKRITKFDHSFFRDELFIKLYDEDKTTIRLLNLNYNINYTGIEEMFKE
jgi:hypothetical protein